jgi:serine/threonine protein kinase
MSKSINYLHNLNPSILHRDIKSMNFLLKYNGLVNHKYLVKVCDFGLAEIRRETLLQSSSFPSLQTVGSFYWKAPELLIPFTRHTKQSDVYSLGIVFWELATERKPWDEYDDEAIIVIQVRTGQRPTIPTDIPEQYKQFIQDSWNHDLQKRPTCFQLMERIYKELDQSNTSENVIDLHPTEKKPEQDDLFNSDTNLFSSTRTGIQVTEEKSNEQQDNLPNITITEPSSSDTTTGN